MASHNHPTTTAIQIPRTGEEFGIAAVPKNPSRTMRPAANDSRASDGLLRRDSARAARKQLMERQTNPSPPAAKWTIPDVLREVGGPRGVPTGDCPVAACRSSA